jgi:hypothetical protein
LRQLSHSSPLLLSSLKIQLHQSCPSLQKRRLLPSHHLSPSFHLLHLHLSHPSSLKIRSIRCFQSLPTFQSSH